MSSDPVTSEAEARRPRSISNYGVLCHTIKTRTLVDMILINLSGRVAIEKHVKNESRSVLIRRMETSQTSLHLRLFFNVLLDFC
jgi:hypothetical protein